MPAPPAPSEGKGAVCIWLASSRPEPRREVAPALRDRSRVQLREVELLLARLDGEERRATARDPPSPVELLAEAARSPTRQVVHGVVACPLGSTAERAPTPELRPRVVEIFLRPTAGRSAAPRGSR